MRSSGVTVPTKAQLGPWLEPPLHQLPSASCHLRRHRGAVLLMPVRQTGNQYLARSALNRARDVRPGGVG